MMDEYKTKVIRLGITFYGFVQGIGFRWRVKSAAGVFGVTGWIKNNLDGTVYMEIQGTEEQIDKVFEIAWQFASIRDVKRKELPVVDSEFGFIIK